MKLGDGKSVCMAVELWSLGIENEWVQSFQSFAESQIERCRLDE
jgi:hypothetical protein